VKRRFASPSAATDGRGGPILVPDGVREHFAAGIGRRRGARSPVDRALASYRAAHPELATEIDQMQRRDLPAGWIATFPCSGRRQGVAGREASGKVLNVPRAEHPVLLGGSATSAVKNQTTLTYEGRGSFRPGAGA